MLLPRRVEDGTYYLPVSPRGLSLRVVEFKKLAPPEERLQGAEMIVPEEFYYKVVVEGYSSKRDWISSEISFSLPNVDSNGLFKIRDVWYAVSIVGLPDPWKPFSHNDYYFLDKKEALRRVIEHAFGYRKPPHSKEVILRSGIFDSFFFGSSEKLSSERIHSTLLSRIRAHPWIQQAATSNFRDKETIRDTVILCPRGNGLDIEHLRFPKELEFKLDPTSTTSSNNINKVYQLCDGAKIENMQIIPGKSKFCRFNRVNSSMILLSPKRAYLVRSAAQNTPDLTSPDKRLISHPESSVHTVNLKTAIMELGIYTFAEAIAISDSAARKMEAQVDTKITKITPNLPKKIIVAPGDIVKPMGKIAVLEIDGKENVLLATRLKEESVLEKVTCTPCVSNSKKGWCLSFFFRSFLSIRTGDKITCSAGYKGVVNVIPDHLMPTLPDDSRIDICISPVSVAKRRTIGILAEMAYSLISDEPINCYGDEIPFSFEAIKGVPKSRLKLRGKKLPEMTFCGILPWMRLVRSGIASRRISAVGTNRPLTGEGFLPDIASASGEILDIDKTNALLARGMKNTVRSMISSGPGLAALIDIVSCIEEPAEDWKEKNDSQSPSPSY